MRPPSVGVCGCLLFFSSRRRHTRLQGDWSSDVCSSDLITKACRYEPSVNRTYAEMAAHHGVAVIPARRAKPRDKAKVEAGVLLVERWILAALRKRRFFHLAEVNQAI